MLTQEQIEDLAINYANQWIKLLTSRNVHDWLLHNLGDNNATAIQRMEIARLAFKVVNAFGANYKTEEFIHTNKRYLKL